MIVIYNGWMDLVKDELLYCTVRMEEAQGSFIPSWAAIIHQQEVPVTGMDGTAGTAGYT